MPKSEKPAPKMPKVKLPAGFKIISNPDFAKVWTPSNIGDFITGATQGIKHVKTKSKQTRILTVKDNNGVPRGIWESKQLSDLFDLVEKGKKSLSVYIQYDGLQKVKGYKNKMKLFTVAVK